MDNIDESQILTYTDMLANLSIFGADKSIHDLSAIIDSIYALIESQVSYTLHKSIQATVIDRLSVFD